MKRLNDKNWLNEEYIVKNRSCDDIAVELGTYRHRVRRALIKNSIPLRSQSDAQSAALKSKRAKHPTKGTHRPESVKVLISEGVANNWSQITPEELERRSNISSRNWENMSAEDKEKLLKAGREAVLKAAKDGSKLERFLQEGLTKAGYVIEYHKEGLIAGDKLQIDMFVPRLSTAIEIDGPSHFFPIWGDEQLSKTMESDRKKTGLLLEAGIVIIRIKQVAKSLSQKLQRDILASVLETLIMVEREFPNQTSRLIEIEV